MEKKIKVIIEFPNEVLARIYILLRNGESPEDKILNYCRAGIIREDEQQLKKDKRKRA